MHAVEIALANAWSEITLVFFTALAPSATLAYLILLGFLARLPLSDEERQRIRKQLWVPLVLAMLGLIAAATHLGNPANALYVLTRVGISPLSNEVCAAVVFLACAAVFWLYGFALEKRRLADSILGVLIFLAGIVLIITIAFAYHVETIASWYHPLMPATMIVSSCVGAPLITLLALSLSKADGCIARVTKPLAICSAGASVIWVGLNAAMGTQLGGIGNAIFTAAELVPCYWLCLAVATALLVAACASIFTRVFRGNAPSLPHMATSALMAILALGIMRFTFYMMHLTVGVAV